MFLANFSSNFHCWICSKIRLGIPIFYGMIYHNMSFARCPDINLYFMDIFMEWDIRGDTFRKLSFIIKYSQANCSWRLLKNIEVTLLGQMYRREKASWEMFDDKKKHYEMNNDLLYSFHSLFLVRCHFHQFAWRSQLQIAHPQWRPASSGHMDYFYEPPFRSNNVYSGEYYRIRQPS